MAWRNRVRGKWLILLPGIILVKLAASSPYFIEKYYASGFYPATSTLQRYVLGWIPFSVGDLLYLLGGISIIWLLVKGFKFLRYNPKSKSKLRLLVGNLISIIICIYLTFNILWGLNYNRKSPAVRFGLVEEDSVLTPDLARISAILLAKTNRSRPMRFIGFARSRDIAIDLFREQGPLHVSPTSIKPSLFGSLGNYMGYSGYYNPFTGEAQVNTTVPDFLIPFVTCHEMAHQAGFAKENEANFVGFLAARKSTDSSMLYSTYFNMFLYANGQLRRMDSAGARSNYEKLSAGALSDLASYKLFLKKYDSPLGTFIDAFYDRYLKLNQQPAGAMSYNRVVLWLLAYYKKNGDL